MLSELAAYGAGPDWFGLGDKDPATHILRTQVLARAATLSEATRALCERWQPGVTLLPMSDDPVRTHVTVIDELDGPRAGTCISRSGGCGYRAAIPARLIVAARAPGRPGPRPACSRPSRPPTSCCSPRPTRSSASAPSWRCRASPLPWPARSSSGSRPSSAARPVHGMADACLTAIGVQTSAAAVAAHYGQELLDGWLVDERDKDAVDAPELAGITVRARPLYMTDVTARRRRSPARRHRPCRAGARMSADQAPQTAVTVELPTTSPAAAARQRADHGAAGERADGPGGQGADLADADRPGGPGPARRRHPGRDVQGGQQSPRAGWSAATASPRSSTPRLSGWWPGAARPGSSPPGTDW